MPYTKDTVVRETILINKLEKFVQTLDIKANGNESNNCDIRIQCKLNFANGTTKRLCIGDFNCISIDGKNIGKCDSITYLVKAYSGYYNYFEKWRINDNDEIKQFGIPDDYKLIVEPD
jgi:hypothetical protein